MLHFFMQLTFLGWCGIFAAYLFVGGVLAGAIYGNDTEPPHQANICTIVCFWPVVLVFFALAASFGLGAWLRKIS